VKLRSLSARQAMTCEQAVTARCRCRCGGALHGAKRAYDLVELAMLAADDPHHVAPLSFRQAALDEQDEPMAVDRPRRCAVCGGLDPGSHVGCDRGASPPTVWPT
jgi:hypothetical protein